MNLPNALHAALERPGLQGQPSVLIYFTDGSTATLLDGAAALKGRTLDQIQRIELHPSGGGVFNGQTNGGQPVVALGLDLHDLPFQVFAVFSPETAKSVGGLLQTPGIVVASQMPR